MVAALQPKLIAEESERFSWLLDLPGLFLKTIKHTITRCDFAFYIICAILSLKLSGFSVSRFFLPHPIFLMIQRKVHQMFCVAHMYHIHSRSVPSRLSRSRKKVLEESPVLPSEP